MKYAFIKKHQPLFSVLAMGRVLEVAFIQEALCVRVVVTDYSMKGAV